MATIFIQITVNIKSSTNTENNNTSDAFADFDAITSGLLGNTEGKGTSFNIKGQAQFFHQSQHSNKQRYKVIIHKILPEILDMKTILLF